MVNETKTMVNFKTGEIIPIEAMPLTLHDTIELGELLNQSGMFPGVTTKAQAVAKILLGRELGLGPVYSLLKIHLITMPGRPATLALSGELVAGLINRSKRYSYDIITHTNEECLINFKRDDVVGYPSKFTLQDARTAGLVKPESNWVKWPRAMLFNRTMTQGAKFFCPELLAGADVLEDIGYDVSPNGEKSKAGEPPPSAWMHFWGDTRKRGYNTEEAVHLALKVESLKVWLAQGKTLDDAIEALPNLTAARDADELYGKAHKPEPSTTASKQVEATPEGKQGGTQAELSTPTGVVPQEVLMRQQAILSFCTGHKLAWTEANLAKHLGTGGIEWNGLTQAQTDRILEWLKGNIGNPFKKGE